MDKLCCCLDNDDLPSFNLNITCPSSCCESRLERPQADVTDFNMQEDENKDKLSDNEEEKTVCCCFIRKSHAKVKKKETVSKHGRET